MKNRRVLRYGVGDQLFLKQFIWFDNEAQHGNHVVLMEPKWLGGKLAKELADASANYTRNHQKQ